MILGDPRTLVYRIVAILIAVTVHEFAHAWTASRLGDPTPRMRGRLSLNPLVHLDLLGSFLLLVVGFGWAKPVEVNPRYFADWRKGMLVVAAAGPVSNILALFAVGLLWKLGVVEASPVLAQLVFSIVSINAVLAVFNMLPVPPLDGSRILSGLLPPAQALAYERLAPYGPLVLLVLLVLPIDLIGSFLRPPVTWLTAQALGMGRL
jgi:Zn-dependent protease